MIIALFHVIRNCSKKLVPLFFGNKILWRKGNGCNKEYFRSYEEGPKAKFSPTIAEFGSMN